MQRIWPPAGWFKRTWWLGGTLVAGVAITLLVAFRANPAPQPQRVSDLVARIEALEETSAAQQARLDELAARLDLLEASGDTDSGIVLASDITIPRSWVKRVSSDGVLSYRHDPSWLLTNDEPGTLDMWLDEDTALFFTWDWSADLLDALHGDEEFLRFFERDLLGSDRTLQTDIIASGALQFMGNDAHYWEIRLESSDGFTSHMLTIFYPCSDRASCNMVLARIDTGARSGTEAAFAQDDWDFLQTFAYGIEFLTVGKTTVLANANLRACPAIDCEITGRLVRGEIIELIGISEDGDWYQLDSGPWIASNLVFGAPPDLPITSGADAI